MGQGGGGLNWPPPDATNLIHAWDFRDASHLTLDSVNINSVADSITGAGALSFSAAGASRPTWTAEAGAYFDGTSSSLILDAGATTLVGDHTFYVLSKVVARPAPLLYLNSPAHRMPYTPSVVSRWDSYANNVKSSFVAAGEPGYGIWRPIGWVHDKGSAPKLLTHVGTGATAWQGDMTVALAADYICYRLGYTGGAQYIMMVLVYSGAHTQATAESIVTWLQAEAPV